MTRPRPSTRLRSARLSRLDAMAQYLARDALAGLKVSGQRSTSTTTLSEPGATTGILLTVTVELVELVDVA